MLKTRRSHQGISTYCGLFLDLEKCKHSLEELQAWGPGESLFPSFVLHRAPLQWQREQGCESCSHCSPQQSTPQYQWWFQNSVGYCLVKCWWNLVVKICGEFLKVEFPEIKVSHWKTMNTYLFLFCKHTKKSKISMFMNATKTNTVYGIWITLWYVCLKCPAMLETDHRVLRDSGHRRCAMC